MSACWKVTLLKCARRTRSSAAARDWGEMSIEWMRAPGLLAAMVTVWAPTPQPASRTSLPAGNAVS